MTPEDLAAELRQQAIREADQSMTVFTKEAMQEADRSLTSVAEQAVRDTEQGMSLFTEELVKACTGQVTVQRAPFNFITFERPTPPPPKKSERFSTSYMDDAVFDLRDVLRRSEIELRRHLSDFDTLVGTGMSGALVIPALAVRLRRKFVIVRKENDDSHHGGNRLLGELGKRWVFVDDFTSSGATRDRVKARIQEDAEARRFETTHVASYYYNRYTSNTYQPTV